MKRKLRLNTLLLLAALPLGALAAEPPMSPAGAKPAADPAASQGMGANPAPMFTQLDANHDGLITKDEAKRSADTIARFDKLDTNHDGKISTAEWAAGNK